VIAALSCLAGGAVRTGQLRVRSSPAHRAAGLIVAARCAEPSATRAHTDSTRRKALALIQRRRDEVLTRAILAVENAYLGRQKLRPRLADKRSACCPSRRMPCLHWRAPLRRQKCTSSRQYERAHRTRGAIVCLIRTTPGRSALGPATRRPQGLPSNRTELVRGAT
jgi:hypothetical protein